MDLKTISDKQIQYDSEYLYDKMAKIIGDFISSKRIEKGISLRELYKKTNISIAVISDLENGNKIPRFETLLRLMLELQIPLNFIFDEKFLDKKFILDSSPNIKHSSNELIRNVLLSEGMSKNETNEIINFINYTKSKRSNKS